MNKKLNNTERVEVALGFSKVCTECGGTFPSRRWWATRCFRCTLNYVTTRAIMIATDLYDEERKKEKSK